VQLSVSVGLTAFSDARRDMRELLAAADQACYAAKRDRAAVPVLSHGVS
jgi:GGDEF domain-containing protein